MKSNEYCCAMCKQIFEKVTPEEEAVKEMKGLFGESCTTEECDLVCDDCFNKLPISRSSK